MSSRPSSATTWPAVLDGLPIVDNGSLDGTPEILAKLKAEGLPLRVVPEPERA
jgi:hypothetical protein